MFERQWRNIICHKRCSIDCIQCTENHHRDTYLIGAVMTATEAEAGNFEALPVWAR